MTDDFVPTRIAPFIDAAGTVHAVSLWDSRVGGSEVDAGEVPVTVLAALESRVGFPVRLEEVPALPSSGAAGMFYVSLHTGSPSVPLGAEPVFAQSHRWGSGAPWSDEPDLCLIKGCAAGSGIEARGPVQTRDGRVWKACVDHWGAIQGVLDRQEVDAAESVERPVFLPAPGVMVADTDGHRRVVRDVHLDAAGWRVRLVGQSDWVSVVESGAGYRVVPGDGV